MALPYSYLSKNLLESTSVDFSVTGYLVDPLKANLVISRVSSIEIYFLNEFSQLFNNNSFSSDANLFLFETIPLFGEIAGLNVIHRPGKQLDSILVSFRTAKVFFYLLNY